jgi:flagellar biosynthesis protein FlhB
MNGTSGDKIHPPTPQRRQQARQQGQVARSRDVVAVAVLVAGLAVLWIQRNDLSSWISSVATSHLSGQVSIDADPMAAVELGRQTFLQMGAVLLPVLAVLWLAAVISQVGQFGILFVPNKVACDPQRLNPINNLQRLVAVDNWMRTGWGLLKLAAMLVVAGSSMWNMRADILGLGVGNLHHMAVGGGVILSTVAVRLLAVAAVLALADFALQRWYHERQLWMTEDQQREASRDERKSSTQAQQRRQHRHQLAQQAIDAEVAQADLVLIAGTSLAIVLRYDPFTMSAPHVLTKGAGPTAVEIYRLAQRHGKWIMDDRRLTREMHRRVPAGQTLPPDMYPAVARMFADLPPSVLAKADR